MHRRLALAVAAAAALLAVAPPAHAQSPDVAFDADPVAGSSTDPTGGWFSLSADAGSRVEQAVAVQNTSGAPLELAVTAVDATTMAVGGASYAAPDAPAELTATWVEVPVPSLRLAPGESRTVPFVVRVPSGARPGDHLAGISIAAPSRSGESTTLDNGASTSIDLRTRRVLAVHVSVPGPAASGIAVHGVDAAVRPPGPQLEIALENTGQRLTRGQGVLTILDDDDDDDGDGDDVRREFVLDTFVPGTSIAYPLPWPDGLSEGSHAVRVELQHDGRTVTWEGDVQVSGEAVKAAVEAAGPAAPGGPAAAGPLTTPSGVSPLALGLAVLGGVAVAAGGQTALRLVRRRSA